MATTTGLVQRLKIVSGTAYAYIGPSPVGTDLLYIQIASGASAADSAMKASMIDTLGSAMAARREVECSHGSSDSEITAVVVPSV